MRTPRDGERDPDHDRHAHGDPERAVHHNTRHTTAGVERAADDAPVPASPMRDVHAEAAAHRVRMQ